MILVQHFCHYFLHLGLPIFVARYGFPQQWRKTVLLLWATMLIDIDHLWANPVFDPCRCSVGYHTFHTWPFVITYCAMLFFPKTRIIGIGLVLHILTDIIDCQFIMRIY
jgi:Family of unknown function (DUF6122)